MKLVLSSQNRHLIDMHSETNFKSGPPHPKKRANFISKMTFFWTIKLFLLGAKRDLVDEDMYETLDEHKSSYLADKLQIYWNKELEKAKSKKREPSVWKAIFAMFFRQIMKYGIVFGISEVSCCIFQPMFIRLIVNSITYGEYQKTFYNYGTYSIIGLAVTCVFRAIIVHWEFEGMGAVGMEVRVAISSMIYRKALRLSKFALEQTTVGQIVNLLSNDVTRFDNGLLLIHFLWIGPLVTFIVSYFIFIEIQWAAVGGIVMLLAFVPLQIWLGIKITTYRRETAKRTDERVRLMNEIIEGIEVIKMYTWEYPFISEIRRLRRLEMWSIRMSAFMRGFLLSFIIFQTRVAVFVSVYLYVEVFDQQITASKAFILAAYYYTMRQVMTSHFAHAIGQVGEMMVSIRRIQTLLSLDENISYTSPFPLPSKPNIAIEFSNITAMWNENDEFTLIIDNAKILKGKMCAVIGSIGAGKTSIVQLILKELPLTSGTINIDGTISFVPQESWVFPGTIKQNILFGLPMDTKRYEKVIDACALISDLQSLPNGDLTIVGEKGAGLSGGQRARVNMARAVYRNADIYLFDDPLSAVDPQVSEHIFNRCFKEFLVNKTRILITHQLQFLTKTDQIFVMNEGRIIQQGTYNELESTVDFETLSAESDSKKMNISDTEYRKDLIVMSSLSETFVHGGSQMRSSAVITNDDYTNVQEGSLVPAHVRDVNVELKVESSWHSLKIYIGSYGSRSFVFIVILLTVGSQVAGSAADLWLMYWVELEDDVYPCMKNYNTSRHSCHNMKKPVMYMERKPILQIYVLFNAILIITTLIRSIAFVILCAGASIKLHDAMFDGIIRTPMRFFDSHPPGRILNRFSKDLGYVDELLPPTIFDTTQIALTILGIIILSSYLSPYLCGSFIIILIILYHTRKFYIRTSLRLKKIESSARSPLYGHLRTTLQGLVTIRVLGVQSMLANEFDMFQDRHTTTWYLYLTTSRALAVFVDMICTIYITFTPLPFILSFEKATGASVGLAVTQAITLNGMSQWGMRQSAEAENYLISVERIQQYTNLPSEGDWQSAPGKEPPSKWPDKGEIRFENLFIKYWIEGPVIIGDINITIQSQDKVGIVGRTGAGKSSLLAALFRLIITDGSIIIDDIDIGEIGLHDVRSKISIIPQVPILFSGTLRKNLDPFNNYDDDILWSALHEVDLKDAVQKATDGLHLKVAESGSNISVGQRQLICLARAIIGNNRILVLDEATANIDPHTDHMLQNTIRKRFHSCTILTIAHRLNTIMDSNKIMVINNSKVAEFDHPYKLLQNTSSIFYDMVQKTGVENALKLKNIAAQSYMRQSLQFG